jgi:hypothetical protein
LRPPANLSLAKNGVSVEHTAIDQDAGASVSIFKCFAFGLMLAWTPSVVAWANMFRCWHNKAEAAMGTFDEEIAWCKERRATAIGDLREFCTGARQFRNKVDITGELEARASLDIKKFDAIISALEAYRGELDRKEWGAVEIFLPWRRSGPGSGGDIGHQLYKEFGAG